MGNAVCRRTNTHKSGEAFPLIIIKIVAVHLFSSEIAPALLIQLTPIRHSRGTRTTLLTAASFRT